jgi:hypothetical protein
MGQQIAPPHPLPVLKRAAVDRNRMILKGRSKVVERNQKGEVTSSLTFLIYEGEIVLW